MDQSPRPEGPPITLWGRISSCNVQKAQWALDEVGVPYQRMDVGGKFGGLDDPAYLALNPHGVIPTLVDGDVVVWESDAIVRYVAARYGSGTLWPEAPGVRATADKWIAWTTGSLYPDWIRLFWALVRTPPSKRDGEAVERLRQSTARRFVTLDHHLKFNRYVAGDAFGIADIPAGMMLYRWYEMNIERPATPHVENWYARLRERSAFRKSICVSYEDLVARDGG